MGTVEALEDGASGQYECAECGHDDHPTSECPNKPKSKLKDLARSAQNSGESAGRLLGEYVEELLADEGNREDLNSLVAADMDNVIAWAEKFKEAARVA